MGIIFPGQPSPLRSGPAGYIAKAQGIERSVAGLLAINPLRGGWEGYTSYDVPLQGVAEYDGKTNYTPPILYQPCVGDITRMPMQLKLGSQSADVKVMSPRGENPYAAMGILQIEKIFLPRAKVANRYYDGAYWQYGECDPAAPGEVFWWSCGEIGDISQDDNTATLELSSMDELANRSVGSVYHIVCQVGTQPPPDIFGAGRCRNQVMNDGPLRADWTAKATVAAGSTRQMLYLTYPNAALSGNALDASFAQHLGNGDLEFLSESEGGGLNALLVQPVRSGGVFGGGVRVYPKISLPSDPVPGDKVKLVAGCRRIKSDCNYFHGGRGPLNFRAQDCPSNSELNSRTKV